MYTKDLSFEGFCHNDMAVDAVIKNFEVIGEATNNVPNKVCEKYPDVEWKEAIGFRNVLAHDYFGIDIEAVWDTIKNNITPFKEHILPGLFQSSVFFNILTQLCFSIVANGRRA